ncbi:MAG: hypothetical protein IPJ65_38435 [Archangiaceae bacterium]|nr:hypothetical protein [Archangiaceae bacterium]
MKLDKLELFHAIADPGSARVRKWVDEHDLLGAVRYRNVFYAEVVVDLVRHGGTEQSTPALWDGEQLFVGPEAVIARLQAHGDVGRES